MSALSIRVLGLLASVSLSWGAWATKPAVPYEPDPSGEFEERGLTHYGANACAGATPIYDLGAFGFNFAGATTDGPPHAGCLNASSAQIWRDVWWRWQSPVTGVVKIETCVFTGIDTKLAVYAPSAPCNPSDEHLLVCNDDVCHTQSSVTLAVLAGQEYLIRLGRYGLVEPAAAGSGALVISSDAAPSVCDGGGFCQTLHLAGIPTASNAHYRTADDFFAPASGVIEGLCWKGRYDLHPGPADNFRVTYWSDAGGTPGAPIASYRQGSGLGVKRTALNIVDSLGVPQFEYGAWHAPLAVALGQRLWVEVRNETAALWFWAPSTSGNGALLDLHPHTGWSDAEHQANRAFCVDFRSACAGDLNGDGAVNFADLNAVLSQFNSACP